MKAVEYALPMYMYIENATRIYKIIVQIICGGKVEKRAFE
jgi:hypothetical protein